MTNRFLVSVAAIALIAGASAANAQGGMNREGGGAATQQSSPSGGSPSGGATKKSTEPSGMSGMKSTQSEQKAQSKEKSSQSEQKSPGSAKGQHAEEPGMKSKSQSSESETKGGAKRAEEPSEKSKTQSTESETKGAKDNMKAEGREGRGTDTNAQRTDERSRTTTGQAGTSAKLSTEQRTRISTVIRNQHVEAVNNVDFAISVGTRVPREHVHLRPLPVEVISIYPEWRGYEFILVRDQIVVVDPRTGEIVDILPA